MTGSSPSDCWYLSVVLGITKLPGEIKYYKTNLALTNGKEGKDYSGVVREEALFVLTCRAFPILRLADLTLETALPIDASFK